MAHILSWLLSLLLLYKYFALFFIIITAGILIPWPANTLLLATGAFASQGYFNVWMVFAVALIANVLGDSVGYLLTRKWGLRFIKEHHLKKYSYVDKLNEYIKSNTRMTIFLTRFVGTVGPAVNFLSGLIGIPYGQFLLFDILGNMCDIGFFLVAGYILGGVWQDFSSITNTIGWILLVVILINVSIQIFWNTKKHQ